MNSLLIGLVIPAIVNVTTNLFPTPINGYLGTAHIVANTPFYVDSNLELRDCDLTTPPVNTTCKIYYYGPDMENSYINVITK